MITKKEIVISFILAINLFLLSFFFSRNWINQTCCPYESQRLYGFPLIIFSISKATKDYTEAQKIYSLHNYELLNAGWELKGGSSNINFGLSLLLNLFFYLVASGICVGSFNAFIFTLTRRVKEGGT